MASENSGISCISEGPGIKEQFKSATKVLTNRDATKEELVGAMENLLVTLKGFHFTSGMRKTMKEDYNIAKTDYAISSVLYSNGSQKDSKKIYVGVVRNDAPTIVFTWEHIKDGRMPEEKSIVFSVGLHDDGELSEGNVKWPVIGKPGDYLTWSEDEKIYRVPGYLGIHKGKNIQTEQLFTFFSDPSNFQPNYSSIPDFKTVLGVAQQTPEPLMV